MTLTDAQLDAISQAMTLSETTDTDIGDSFCGQLQDLNQVLRAGILSDTETDAIMREIQKWPVAYKNVATLMEVMEVLEGPHLLNPGAGAVTLEFPDGVSTNPKPQDTVAAAYAAITKANLYGTAFIAVDDSFPDADFDPSTSPNKYTEIIVNAITAEGTLTGGTSEDYENQIWGFTDIWLPESGPTVVTAQAEAQTCVDTALGAPDIYKNIMFDYLTKAGLSRFQYNRKHTLKHVTSP